MYSPSPGTVYPRLSALEQEGLIEVVGEEEGRTVYRLTDAGRRELEARAEELRELGRRLKRSAKEIASEIRDDVRSSVRDLRREILEAARDVRREERRAARAAREQYRSARDRYGSARDAARGVSSELRSALRSLQSDLDGFVADVVSAAQERNLDRDRLSSLRDVLGEAKATILDALGAEDDTRRRRRD